MRAKKFEAKRREIQIGKGRELNEVMRDHLLIFEKVKNKVAFVNLGFVDPEKKINLPFKLEEGKEAPLLYLPKPPFTGNLRKAMKAFLRVRKNNF